MPRLIRAPRGYRRLAVILGVTGLIAIAAPIAGQSPAGARPGPAPGDWVHYAADVRGTRYLPLDQIDASNFNTLEVAWRFSTANLGPRPEFNLQGTPLVVGGRLYATGGGGNRRAVVALDASDRRAAVEAWADEGARARCGAAPQLGPRPVVLDRRAR